MLGRRNTKIQSSQAELERPSLQESQKFVGGYGLVSRLVRYALGIYVFDYMLISQEQINSSSFLVRKSLKVLTRYSRAQFVPYAMTEELRLDLPGLGDSSIRC